MGGAAVGLVGVIQDAFISLCGLYRYYLIRQWDAALPVLTFVMLNPSTADAFKNDPTIRRCIAFAVALGFGGIVVVNMFAYRTSSPVILFRAARKYGDIIGPLNDAMLGTFAAGVTVCAWGANARKAPQRAAQVLQLIRAQSQPHALRLLADGTPEHPLMLPGDCRLIPV